MNKVIDLVICVITLPFKVMGGFKNVAITIVCAGIFIALYSSNNHVKEATDGVVDKATSVMPSRVRKGAERLGVLSPKRALPVRVLVKSKDIAVGAVEGGAEKVFERFLNAIFHPLTVAIIVIYFAFLRNRITINFSGSLPAQN